MLLALKKRHFNPAKVDDKPVWQNGKTYVIHLKKGHEMILEQMRNEQTKYIEKAFNKKAVGHAPDNLFNQ